MPGQSDSTLSEKVDAAFRQAAVKVLRLARQTGTPVIIWDNGRVRAASPDEFKHLENAGASQPAAPDHRPEE
jgi:hypothetical protein